MAHRSERLNHQIRREISELLQRQVKDPRLDSFVTVTDVAVSSDLRIARVYISHFGTAGKKEETMQAITAASGYIRKELGKRLRLRRVPELSFRWDDSIEQGAHIEELLDRVAAEDDIERHTEYQ
jgi:ribosome-binding factor A